MAKFSGLTILLVSFIVIGIVSTYGSTSEPPKPHIIIIMADDIGFNDVGYHGSEQIPTPNIDALGYQGLILNRHYTPALCTPSRSALMTGKYPFKTGMQHFVIPNDEPWGLPVEEKIMSQYFKEVGYKTNLIGKWHIGLAQKNFTPPYRGVDHFRGYLGAMIDYYNHSLQTQNFTEGYDMRFNEEVDYENVGVYATDMLTNYANDVINQHNKKDPLFLMVHHLAPHTANEYDPLQAPQEVIEKFSYISDPNRRIYAAMVSKLDDSVGEIVKTLDQNQMLDNSVILFFADNGAPSLGLHANYGSNSPLRGQKNSPWEGGIRVAASLWSPLLNTKHTVSDLFIYNTDWLPTLGYLAGVKITENIDGLNIWDWLNSGSNNNQRDIVHNINQVINYASFYRNGYKYITGTTVDGEYDDWIGEIPSNERPSEMYFDSVMTSTTWSVLDKYNEKPLNSSTVQEMRRLATVSCNSQIKNYCDPLVAPCLFNIIDDPCERNNLADVEKIIVNDMEQALDSYKLTVVPVNNKPSDPKCDPIFYNNTWTWWLDINGSHSIHSNKLFLIIISIVLSIKMMI